MRLFDRINRCIVGLSVVLLAGCGPPQADALWQDYVLRLSRLAGDAISAPPLLPTRRPRWPGQRQIHRSVPQWRTDLFGWVDLIDCQLSTLVAERNSGLGRVQHPSLRLAYELEFIALADQCLQTLGRDDAMRPWLAAAATGKRDALPALYWNATLGSPEWRDAQAPRSIPATLPLPVDAAALATTLTDWASQLDASSRGTVPNITALEAQLQALTVNHPGLLTDSLRLGTAALDQATAVLVSVDTQWLCPQQRPSTRARYFHNVFTRIYAGKVQPWLSAVWRDSQALAEALQRLRASLPADDAGQAVARWIDEWLQLRLHFRQALDGHVQAWQTLLGDCRLMPGQAPLASTRPEQVNTANDADRPRG